MEKYSVTYCCKMDQILGKVIKIRNWCQIRIIYSFNICFSQSSNNLVKCGKISINNNIGDYHFFKKIGKVPSFLLLWNYDVFEQIPVKIRNLRMNFLYRCLDVTAIQNNPFSQYWISCNTLWLFLRFSFVERFLG